MDSKTARTSLALLLALLAVAGIGCTQYGGRRDPATLQQQVLESERAFARTMADRDHAAFTSFLSDEAIFFDGEHPLRGKAAVAAGWAPYFTEEQAPFSWAPDQVQVLESGTLALSSGPVYAQGGEIMGRFNSTWRQEAPGKWRVVFDKGSPVCDGAR
jgi:ketosteroid isomerase-like protein